MNSKYLSKTLKAMAVVCIAGIPLIAAGAPNPPSAPPPGYSDPGVQLNRNREHLEYEQNARRIQEERKQQSKVEKEKEAQPQEETEKILFLLRKVVMDDSEVLSAEEINTIIAKYVGQEVSLPQLKTMVGEINKIYEKKGYMTCRAILPPQTIKGGVVHIKLVEGRTGQLIINNNKTTDSQYINNRLSLQKGRIDNIYDLNRSLLRFNGTNDVQLRIFMRAGEEAGTTDYVITVYEPKRYDFTSYTDNAGSESTGLWRTGLFYTNKSLSGRRDSLMLSGILSEGSNSGSFSYTAPVGRRGAKLGLQYSANSTKIIDGDLEALDVRGSSNFYGISLTQPLVVTENIRTTASLEYGRQNSRTDFLGIHWVDDTIKGYTASFSMLNYGKKSVVFQKHNYRFGSWKNIDSQSKNFGKYHFNGLFQKVYGDGEMLSGKLDAQWSGSHYLPSAEQFYIGGTYSVRGYKESLLGGDHGVAAGIEYSWLTDKKVSAFVFWDYGAVYGASAFDDHILMSTGVGIKATIAKNLYGSLTLGIPLHKELNGSKSSKTRTHFMCSGKF